MARRRAQRQPAQGQPGRTRWTPTGPTARTATSTTTRSPDLGRKRVRWLDTPHVPHNGDAGLIYEETTGTLFSSDLFTQTGPADPTTESDIVAPALAVAERLPFMPPTPMAEPTLRRLAALKPTTIALMHGPTFKGDGAAALEGVAEGGDRDADSLRKGKNDFAFVKPSVRQHLLSYCRRSS